MIKHFFAALILSFSTLAMANPGTLGIPSIPDRAVIQSQLEQFKHQLRITTAQESKWNAFASANMQTVDMGLLTALSNVKTVVELYDTMDKIQKHTATLFQMQRKATKELYAVLDERQRTLLNTVMLRGGLAVERNLPQR